MIEIRIDTSDATLNVFCDKPTKDEMNFFSKIGQEWHDWYFETKEEHTGRTNPYKIGAFVTGKNATDGKYYMIQDIKPENGHLYIKILDQWLDSANFIVSNGINQKDKKNDNT